MPSRRLGQYELVDQLGAPSGMGSVYIARDVDLHREVAIKELLPHLSRDPDFAARFRAEAENLARLSHPNITTLYSLGREGESEYMVMELIRGHTLKEVMGRLHMLGQRESLAVIAQAASALAYAHRMGVIHRDIKPSNIMITDDGLLKIMDFGISRARGSQRQTRDGGIVGTLLYISPEQLRSAEGDERSDMYSLAVTLYEMLTGHAPLRASNEYELMRLHLETPPEPMSSLLPGIDPQVDAAVLRALAKNPDDRFANVEDFARALGVAAVQGEAVEILRQCHQKAFDAEATVVFRPSGGTTASRAAASGSETASGSRTGSVARAEDDPTRITTAARAADHRQTEPPAPTLSAAPPAPARRGKMGLAIGLTFVVALIALGTGYLFLPDNWMGTATGSRSTPVAPVVRQAAVTPVLPAAPNLPTAPSLPAAPAPSRPVALPDLAVPPPQQAPEPPNPAPSRPAEAPVPPAVVTAPPPQPEPPRSATQATPAAVLPQAVPSPGPPIAVAPPAVAPPPVVVPPVAASPPTVPAVSPPPVVAPSVAAPPSVQLPATQPALPPVPEPPPSVSPQQAWVRPPVTVPPSPAIPTETPAVEGIVSAAAGTHAIMIGGRFITLFGIEPNSPSQAQFDQDRLVVEKLVRGITAACYQRPQNRFKCTARDGQDLAMLALKAGVVRPAQNAPPEYRSPR